MMQPRLLFRLLVLALVLSPVSGCGLIKGRSEPPPATLADLQPVARQPAVARFEPMPREQLLALYTDVLEVTDDPQLKHRVARRIADIRLMDAEDKLAEGGLHAEVFTATIHAYRELMQQKPDSADNDEIIYQLSRAYQASGQPTESLQLLEQLSAGFQGSPHFSEAEFRKAEHYFADGKYAAAESAYSRVVAAGEGDRHYPNAQYMLAWSRFKQQRYAAAVEAFLDTLDYLLPRADSAERLSPPQRELLKDCLRVLAVSFSYLGGETRIASSLQPRGDEPRGDEPRGEGPDGGPDGDRHYAHLLYWELGELYLKQERYRDSATVFAAFVSHYPASGRAHQFQARVISAYQQGNFPEQVIAEKQRYIEQFAIGKSWWTAQQKNIHQQVLPTLKSYVGELAGYHHSLAQGLHDENTQQSSEARAHFQYAAGYYQQFIDHFASDPALPEKTFLLAEIYAELGDHQKALPLFERVAYDYADAQRGGEAGYAAILCYQQIADSQDQAKTKANNRDWRRQYVDSELRFVRHFPGDKRSQAVFSHALDTLFDLEDYAGAVTAAREFTRLTPAPSSQRLNRAWQVLAHSHFQLAQYRQAEHAYRQLLARLSPAHKNHRGNLERLAASIYRQGEAAVSGKRYLEAAQQFARVLSINPPVEIRATAHYDAAHYYTLAGSYREANALLREFRKQYPRHRLSENVPELLLANYEKLEQWQQATAELDILVERSRDRAKQGQLLYLAAQYQDREQNYPAAIERYRRYAHGWEQPLGLRMEAMNRLAEIYRLTNELKKQHFWFRKMLDARATAGSAASERSAYLAAGAASQLAVYQDQQYAAVTLSHPLKKSLAHKKKAMETAVAAHRRVIALGVQPFSSRATYSLARAYRLLSDALLQSPRPDRLDALAAEQYELMLEDLAFPFEEKAIAIHESNVRLAREGLYNSWVRQSFAALAKLNPARYAKTEASVNYVEEIL